MWVLLSQLFVLIIFLNIFFQIRSEDFFGGFETDSYPSRQDDVRRGNFFRAAILWASRALFFAPEAAGGFIFFKNGVFLQIKMAIMFSRRNFT